jgi:DNA-binding SARP family transcriptional activator
MNAPIRIDLLAGTVSGTDTRVSLSPLSAALLGTIAAHMRPVTRSRIVADLWPERDSDDGVFDVALHRLRRAFGNRDIVRLTPSGYALADDVVTDLDELGRLALRVRDTIDTMSAEKAAELRGAFGRLLQSAGANARQRMPSSLEHRIRALAAEIGERLAAHALRSGDSPEALSVAELLIEFDPCDENAWEIAIRAHLQANDRAGAIRALRAYAYDLDRELGLAPSPHLVRLIDDPHAPSSQIAMVRA